MMVLWAGPHAEFHGEFVEFAPVTCSPRPVNGTIPVLVGGDTEVPPLQSARPASPTVTFPVKAMPGASAH